MKIKSYISSHLNNKTIVYAVFWFMMLLLPILGNYFSMNSRNILQLDWDVIASQWLSIVPFMIIFLVSSLCLVPLLFMKQRYVWYILSVVALSLSLLAITHVIHEEHHPHFENRLNEHFDPADDQFDRPDNRFDRHDDDFDHSDKPFNRPVPPSSNHLSEPDHAPDALHSFHPEPIPSFRFARIFHGPWTGDLFLAMLLITFNIAVELFFKSQRDKEAIRELQYNEVQTQLEYLKYQINPHFFMNTLNNIHALVDIDTEKAKQTIVELSKLMRYLLYESDKKFIPLEKEVNFLRHYIELMRIRYPSDMLTVITELPSDSGSILIPPLLFISFVENAFKHGVSFRNESFVNLSLAINDDKILFRCSNSNAQNQKDQHHGIGLDNIRRRLDLLYPSQYTLSIGEKQDEFDVQMVIPATYPSSLVQ